MWLFSILIPDFINVFLMSKLCSPIFGLYLLLCGSVVFRKLCFYFVVNILVILLYMLIHIHDKILDVICNVER